MPLLRLLMTLDVHTNLPTGLGHIQFNSFGYKEITNDVLATCDVFIICFAIKLVTFSRTCGNLGTLGLGKNLNEAHLF